MVAVNKAEEDKAQLVKQAVRELKNALHIVAPVTADWQPPVLTCSALHNQGLDDVWANIHAFTIRARASGALEDRRRQQMVRWMWDQIEDRLLADFRSSGDVAKLAPELEAEIISGGTTPTLAAERLLEEFYKGRN